MKKIYLIILIALTAKTVSSQSGNDNKQTSSDSLYITVYSSFAVDKKGNVKDIKIIKTECDSCEIATIQLCEAEALSTLRKMPKWEPGKQGRKKVEVEYNLPIKFVIAKTK